MKFAKIICFFILILILTFSLLGINLRAEDDDHESGEKSEEQAAPKKSCYDCHKEAQERFKKKVVHPPVADEDCTACHEEHGDKKELKLSAAVPELCLNCHDADDKDLKKAHQDYPIKTASCIGCHNPHASDNEKLIRTVQHSPFEDRDCKACHGEPGEKITTKKEGAKLCYECHDAKNDKKNVHPPVEDGDCFSCHSPHAADNEKQLIFKGAEVCYQCHDRMDKKKFLHKPLAEGLCVKCHSPHSSNYPHFLLKPFPEDFYPVYADGIYDLCFSCHKDMISKLAQKIGGVTNFVRNNENLHARHVQEKGRNCKACHDMHGSDQPKQIRNEVPFGKRYKYPINFTPFTDKKGGRCVVGCHKPQTYGPTVIQTDEN